MRNEFMVGLLGDGLVLLKPVPQRLTVAQALNLAAWLVALADDGQWENLHNEALTS